MYADDPGAMGSRLQVSILLLETVLYGPLSIACYINKALIYFSSQFRLIDLGRIAAHEGSWDLANFHNLIARQIAVSRRSLTKAWYSGIQEIFLVVMITLKKNNIVDNETKKRSLQSSWNSAK